MEQIKDIINLKIPKRKTNKYWIISEEVGLLTGTTPNRWLRFAKKNFPLLEKTIVEFKEVTKYSHVQSKSGYFTWLYKRNI